MLKIISHLGNSNHDHDEIQLHICSHNRKDIIRNVNRNREKLEPLYAVSRNIKWYIHFAKLPGSSFKMLKTELPHEPSISLCGTYLKEIKHTST